MSKIKQIRTSAKSAKHLFQDDDMEAMKLKLSMPCHYCNFKVDVGEILNGLDRIDGNIGYTDANTVTCCATCNFMKHTLQKDVFIDRVRCIADYRNVVENVDISRIRLAPFSGRDELRNAQDKTKSDLLSLDEKNTMWASTCYLCGRSPCFGIDRVDPYGDYTMENSNPCCTVCNYMKKDMALEDFDQHVNYIYLNTQTWEIQDVSDVAITTLGGIRDHVAVLGKTNKITLIFPSIGIASSIIKADKQNIHRSINNTGAKCRGYVWEKVSAKDYFNQHIEYDDAIQIIAKLQEK